MKCYHATAISQGMGIGRVYRVEPRKWSPVESEKNENLATHAVVEENIRRYQRAAEEFAARNAAMEEVFRDYVDEERMQILTVQKDLLADPSFIRRIEETLRQGESVEMAVSRVCRSYAERLEALEHPVLRQRGSDYRDLETQLLQILRGDRRDDLGEIPEGAVVLAEEVTPSQMFRLAEKKVAAILVEQGGYASHAAILARAMELPMVVWGKSMWERFSKGELLIVDGTYGNVYQDGSEEEIQIYREKARKRQLEREALQRFRGCETRTADGQNVLLMANICQAEEAAQAMEDGVDGVGLLRTELMFRGGSLPLRKNRQNLISGKQEVLPDRKVRDDLVNAQLRLYGEEVQYQIFRETQTYLQGKNLNIRTFDLSQDKTMQGFFSCTESGLNLWLKRPELHKPQLRAILRAAADGPVTLMFPQVTSAEEVSAAKLLLKQAAQELTNEKIRWKEPSIGVMMETASAWKAARELAEEVDFFSIGTNDLISDILKEDRIHKIGHGLCNPLALQAIREIIEIGHAAGIPVGICGEAAAEPGLAPLWIAWELDALSVNPVSLLSVRRQIALWTKAEAEQVAAEVMQKTQGQQILCYLWEQRENISRKEHR